MKTAIVIIALVVHAFTLHSQTYFNLQGGWAARQGTDTSTLTYQVGIRYQITDIGVKASFNQTDGIQHTMDLYTLSAVYQPLDALYLSLGASYKNGRGWSDNSINPNIGINGLIPLTELAKIKATIDHTFNGITNIMVGVQLELKLRKHGTNRFF